MTIKPDYCSNDYWRSHIFLGSVDEATRMIAVLAGSMDLVRIEELVTLARSNRNPPTPPRGAASQAGVSVPSQVNPSADDSSVTFVGTQIQMESGWSRLLACLFPWTKTPLPTPNLPRSQRESNLGQIFRDQNDEPSSQLPSVSTQGLPISEERSNQQEGSEGIQWPNVRG